MLATTAADVRGPRPRQKIAALMGMEGGHMIDDDLRHAPRLRRPRRALPDAHALQEQQLGRFVHRHAEHNGLTDFGKQVVRELNRLGVMVDISHVADKTFSDVWS